MGGAIFVGPCSPVVSAVSPGSEGLSHYDPLKPFGEVNLKPMRQTVCLHMSKVISQLPVWSVQEGAGLPGQRECPGSSVGKAEECSPVRVTWR